MYNLLDLWKFLLHNWIRLQVIAFFLFIGIYMPCCVSEFLTYLYRYSISWNQAFRYIINNTNRGSENFVNGMKQSQLPDMFQRQSVNAFILHNITVLFIVQLFIFFMWIVLKIWDCIVQVSGNCMYRLLVLFELTLLIFGYLFMAVQAFVFSAINFKWARWDHAYFVICFLISVMYILVFACFWIYSLIRLVGSQMVFQDFQ